MGIIDEIKQVESEKIEEILQAVLSRYRELYPHWEISVLTLDKEGDRIEQLTRIIGLLEKLKE